MSNNFFSCLIWIIIISSVENLYTKFFYSKIYWNIYKLQCFVHCMNGEVEVAIVDTKAAKSLISLCYFFSILFFLMQEGRNGQPKVKRLKAIDDVGMTSSDNDEKDSIYGALVVLG